MNKAKSDLKAAEVLLEGDLDNFESVGFHAQQSAEKFIKAFLVRHQLEFPKTHDISQLRKLVFKVDPALSLELEPVDALTPYGVEFRYPGDFIDFTRQQAKRALELAEQAKNVVMNHLNLFLAKGRPADSED